MVSVRFIHKSYIEHATARLTSGNIVKYTTFKPGALLCLAHRSDAHSYLTELPRQALGGLITSNLLQKKFLRKLLI
jgi:hypothetical protein